jgi:hypothetical protein
MSIAYVLAGGRVAGLQPVARSGEVIVHRNPAALPLAYWTDGTRVVMRANMLALTTSASHVVVDAPAEGVVVVTQQDAAGWEVEVDGAPAAPLRAGVFRAVRVTRGRHNITWRYRPRSVMIGIALTIFAIARMLLSSTFVKRKWHKKIFSRA